MNQRSWLGEEICPSLAYARQTWTGRKFSQSEQSRSKMLRQVPKFLIVSSDANEVFWIKSSNATRKLGREPCKTSKCFGVGGSPQEIFGLLLPRISRFKAARASFRLRVPRLLRALRPRTVQSA